jgi:hypothetical protein
VERFLKVSLLAAPVICCFGIFLMTLGTDEAWILMGPRGLNEFGKYGEGSVIRSDYSTAGPHTVLAFLLYGLGRGRLEVIRILSPLSLAALVIVLGLLTHRVQSDRGSISWIAICPILAVRGTFMLGAQAYGEVLATSLVAGGALLWATLPVGTWRRRLWVGLILGLAAAARLNCVLGAIALPLAALLFGSPRWGEVRDGLFSMVTALACLGIQVAFLYWVSVPLQSEAVTASLEAYGLGHVFRGPLAYFIPERLNYWIVGEDFLPFSVAVLITAGWLWARRQVERASGMDFLLTFAWLLWIVWHVQAPIAHLRYLWPAMVSFYLVGGVVLARLYRRAVEEPLPALRLGICAVCVALVFSGYLEGARTYLGGDSDALSWEWQRAARQSLQYGPFSAIRSQRQMCRHLQNLPPQDRVATLGVDTALSFLTHRALIPIESIYPGANPGLYRRAAEDAHAARPRWLALLPFVNRHPDGYLSPALCEWIAQNCALEARYGPYILYKITGSLPDRYDLFRLRHWESSPPLLACGQ